MGALAVFGDEQTGRLDFANWRTEAVIDLVERCEKRDADAIKKARRGFFGRVFGG